MSALAAKELLAISEPCLLAATLIAVARKRGLRRFPAFGAYLACRLGVSALLIALIYSVRFSLVEKHVAYAVYYYVYWIGYLAGAGIALLLIQEIFKYLVQPLPGLRRYGLAAFRWVSLTSVLISLVLALYPADRNRSLLVAATGGATRCISVLELCLLAFILVSMQTLRLSPRSRHFGVAIGLGTMAAADLFGSAFALSHSPVALIVLYGSQAAVVLASAVWMAYFLQPAGEEEFAPRAISTSLERWNEIAGALTESAPQIALTTPANFFLQDVELVVDRVLEKNSANSAS